METTQRSLEISIPGPQHKSFVIDIGTEDINLINVITKIHQKSGTYYSYKFFRFYIDKQEIQDTQWMENFLELL